MMQQLGFTARDIFEERTDRCKPRVSASRAVAAFILAERQEPPDDVGINVGYMQLSRRQPGLCCRVFQQEPEGVAIAGDRVWAGLHLGQQPLGEEPLHVDGQWIGRDHDAPSSTRRSARAAANCISSGTASIYQNVCLGSEWPR